MNKIMKWIISFAGVLVLSFTLSTTVSASEVHDGIPTPIQGRYWSAIVSRKANSVQKHMYFYATKDGFVLKNTANGTIRCKWILYTHDYSTYVLNGSDNSDPSKAVWIFIHQLRIGIQSRSVIKSRLSMGSQNIQLFITSITLLPQFPKSQQLCIKRQ